MSAEHDIGFRSMGSDIRLIVGRPLRRADPSAAQAAEIQREFIEQFAARMSRFVAESELSRLNADRRSEVPASPLLRELVGAGIWAARRTGGLVDPTLLGELEAAGYSRSLIDERPASLRDALAAAPPRRPARAHPARRWRQLEVDRQRGVIRRRPGIRIDSGGIGKGLAADIVAFQLCGHARYVVDCGGDIAVGGVEALVRPYEIEVEHPLSGETIHTLRVASGGVATSGLNVRVWRGTDGTFGHHLLDPATGRPAWTGLIGATALGASVLEAETLTKAALLLGPAGARRVLAEQGGLVVHDDGDVELIGPIDEPARMRLRVLAKAA
ncbi:MAG TPA: FAD:protein FMN transferase [Solirubrobacteraceae bacterium]|jgi:thiamine biosynthesis lipoprotein